MGDSRRRQFHSCDPCRKGKRGCDAPENRTEILFSSCSNCKKWKKECTFNWLSTNPTIKAKGNQEKKRRKTKAKPCTVAADTSTDTATPDDSVGIPSIGSDVGISVGDGSYGGFIDDGLQSAQWFPVNPGDGDVFALPGTGLLDLPSSSLLFSEAGIGGNDTSDPYAQSLVSWNIGFPDSSQLDAVPGKSFTRLDSLPTDSLDYRFDVIQQLEEELAQDSRTFPSGFCMASDNTAKAYARSTMTHNLLRIYNDSMENALSCWLTEHNCPYTDSIGDLLLPYSQRKEWGPDWSNRMCIRVCHLDRASSLIRGRALSAEEDKTAARALHLAIVAFASQWTQHAQRGPVLSVPAGIDEDERLIKKDVWNEARHALEHSTRIPSFRVIFANIIFSLTQSPLDKGDRRDQGLGQLLENDSAPIFLENANRQLYTFRHKFTKLQRSNRNSPQVDPILSSQDHRSTLNLLFWLGIMFDTLSAAMYQRPLVVSDEDSQITSISPPPTPAPLNSPAQINLDCWDLPSDQPQTTTLTLRQKQDVWGDFFLHPSPSLSHQEPTTQLNPHPQLEHPKRWPCTYAESASILSSATPVKVLLYRRVTQLQNLIYRGATPSQLELVIQKTLLVYNHWQQIYAPFMTDCVTNHAILPPRIQSWYVILDGHWHLAAMLLAEVVEEIDNARLGLDSARETRNISNFVETLRRENALAVGALARASLQGQNPGMEERYHDSVNEVAFLVEPWTVVLVNCFAKGGYISAERAAGSGDGIGVGEVFRLNCGFCICALEYLGRKSDMASLVARNLARLLEGKGRRA
ncbi:hypothetical protein BDV12DRAFT_188319 [Aspergillus spectabilis]